MKILIAEFHQETNSFMTDPSTRKDYEVFGIQKGEEVLQNVDEGSAMKGILDALSQEKDMTLIPSYRMWANAAGPVESSVPEEFMDNVRSVLKKNLPVDGICISMHGATQSQDSDDVCGDILAELRDLAGEETIIAATFDLHANITSRISGSADILCGYHTYPHVDFYETGYRAASLCLREIKDGRKLYKKHIAIPMIEPASGYTTLEGPFGDLMRKCEALVKQSELVDFSIFQMQPWLDVADGQTSVITYAEEENNLYAEKMARALVGMRHELLPKMNAVEDIVEEAERHDDGKPVVLVDSADSTNAGAAGDSAYVLDRILEKKSAVRGAIALCCKPAVETAFRLGVGNWGEFVIGAAISPDMSDPVTAEGKVVSLHDGIFVQEGPAKRGLRHNMGKTAVIQVGNTTVIATSEFLLGPGDLQLFRHFGVEPTMYQLIAVKACTSYRAGYSSVTDRIYDADTPGAAASVLTRFHFKKLPEHFYPFQEITCRDIRRVR